MDTYDVTFNREVVGKAGRYWTTSDAVRDLVESAEAYPAACRARGLLSRERARLYDWDDMAMRYEALCLRLAAQGPLQHRPSGRRAEGSEE